MSQDKPTVVLLHGLARSHYSFSGLRRHLEKAGYPTWAMTYPWRRHALPELAAVVAERIRTETRGELVAVTHSFGGIIVRHMGGVRFRSLVMIAPPNRGSRLARAFQDVPVYKWLHGKSGDEVLSSESWPSPPAPFGVIAGTRALAASNPVSWLATPATR
jgi:pimeloyl-ACP methyl ester carboxylesterase